MSYLIIGIEGAELSDRERSWLSRDEVGGAIVFTRNFHAPEQLEALVAAVKSIDPDALLMVDQEGGRVQRIGAPATVLPPLGCIGKRYDEDEDDGLALAMVHGQLMASEMLSLGIDLSLAPVLDLDRGCRVIGDRAFHADPDVVKLLACAYVKGMRDAGMAACGKHFPGHGSVLEDTHLEAAVDRRTLAEIVGTDMVPFTVSSRQGLAALMMSHVIYPALDDAPAGYSRRWIQEIVRERMGFQGVIISDDLGMAAACDVGGFEARLKQAMDAGSDLVLVCRPEDVAACFDEVGNWPVPGVDPRESLRGRFDYTWEEFSISDQRIAWTELLAELT